MRKKSGVALITLSLVLGTGLGAAVGGCGEDRDEGSVEIEGGTTGTTGTTGTVGTTGTAETTGTTGTTETTETTGTTTTP